MSSLFIVLSALLISLSGSAALLSVGTLTLRDAILQAGVMALLAIAWALKEAKS